MGAENYGRAPGMLAVIIVILSALLMAQDCSASGGNIPCTLPYGPDPNRYFPTIVSTTRGFLFPNSHRNIIINSRESVQLICPGRDNNIINHSSGQLSAKCRSPGRLLEETSSHSFITNCTKPINETILETGIKCGSMANSKLLKIGWDILSNGFKEQIEICFNEEYLTTEYTRHTLNGSIVPFRDGDKPWIHRPGFKQDRFFSHITPKLSMAYTQKSQLDTLKNLLGSTNTAQIYIGGWGSQSYLAKGHLSPDADFFYISWQDATYHYINAIPQWQPFNNGNWKALENKIRIKATRPQPRELTIYTGTHGTVKLPDENNNEVEIFLSEGNGPKVPVPKYIWKIVYDSKSNEAVAFVLINNPGSTGFPSHLNDYLCPNICDRIQWIDMRNWNDPKKGLIGCCTIESLRSKVPHIPNLTNARLMARGI